MAAIARAHTNIALVKYWGKRDAKLILPQTASLSLTLDGFYTTTRVAFDPQLGHDHFTLDGQVATPGATKKVTTLLDLVRKESGQTEFARVDSLNHVPTAAGLASSASAFAALAAAATKAAGLRPSRRDLSRLARRGSGSATRSVYGGLVEWLPGDCDENSYARPVADPVPFAIEMLAILVDTKQKAISSRDGMRLAVETSPYYPAWRQVVKEDMARMKAAINDGDLNQIGHIAQENALRMHALNLSADPGYTYFAAETLTAMQLIDRLRAGGLTCYYTIDAGPNVKVIYDPHDRKALLQALSPVFGRDRLVVAKPGPGIQYLDRLRND